MKKAFGTQCENNVKQGRSPSGSLSRLRSAFPRTLSNGLGGQMVPTGCRRDRKPAALAGIFRKNRGPLISR
jgi:hypothetical protein